MTLREFVKAFMEANNDTRDVDAMCKHITVEARKVAQNGTAVLDEETVEKIILGAKLEAPKEQPKTEWEKTKSGAMKIKKDPPKEKAEVSSQKPKGNEMKTNVPDQMDIFSLGVGLYD